MVRKHCLVICAKRYNGHELWVLLGILHKRGVTFEVVSQEKLIRDELTLRPNILERTVYDVQPIDIPSNFDAVIVVSGNMEDTEAYWDDKHVQALLQSAKTNNLLIAAICCSVPTLAPFTRDVKVSFFPLVRSRKRLQRYGAHLQTVSLTVDSKHRTITAENQMITHMWATEICNELEGRPPEFQLVESGYTPRGGPRYMPPEVERMIADAKKSKTA